MHCAGVFSQIENFACDRPKIKKFFLAENHEFFKGMCKHYEYYVLNIVYKFCLAVSDTFSKNNLHMYSPIFRVIAHAPILGIIYVGVFFSFK